MKLKAVVVGILAATAAFAAEDIPLTFNAVLTAGKDQRYGVATEGGARSAWLAIGGDFEGYKLTSFDEPAQTLVFEREGKSYRVPLAAGNVQTLASKATLADASEVLATMKFEEMLGRMIEQQKNALAGVSKQMMGQLGGQVSQEDFGAFQSKVLDLMWAEMKPEELKGEVARIYSEIFSREELRGLGEFYKTPAGVAMIDKQPALQQKMMEVMMPRMMRAMPKIQQMAQQFAAEQSAKKNPPVPAPATK